MHNESVKKVNANNTKGLVKKTDYDNKVTKIERKTPSITGLATTVAFNTVKNAIPNVSHLFKKTKYNANILDIESKYFSTSYYNEITNKIIDDKVKEKKLVNETTISRVMNNSDLNKRIEELATKVDLKAEQNKILKLQAFDSSYFPSKSHFVDDGTHNC